MPSSKNREYRQFSGQLEFREGTPDEPSYIVEGYAATFKPYVLASLDGVDYMEQIDPHAFDEADMTDVKFLYNHTGMVFARAKRGTLKLDTDNHGLHVEADLSTTQDARNMYESIKSGNVDQMSFAFTVAEDSYNVDTHTRTILKLAKIYDVSAVSEPANPDTDITASMRDYVNGAIDAERAERLAREEAGNMKQSDSERRSDEPANTTDTPKTEKTKSYEKRFKSMTYNEINYLNADGINAKLAELEARKAELSENTITDEVNAEMRSIANTIEMLEARKAELAAMEQRKADAAAVKNGAGVPHAENHEESAIEKRARTLIETGKMEMRQLLSTDTLRPDAAKLEIGELPTVISSIVDDVHAFALDGVGAWGYAYRDTDSVAAAVTEGSKIGGTAGTFKTGKIEPTTWGVLDEISNLVKKFSPLDYEASVRNNAYLALRRYAKREIVKAILKDGSLAETKAEKLTIDENALRTIVLGFNSDETVAGGAKMYLSKATLIKFGQLRNDDKKPLYDITFTDENNGIIQEGGMAVNFSILSDLAAQHSEIDEIKEGAADIIIYGQPGAIDMPLWGNYTVETDEGGDYFQRNMLGIRGLQTAGVGVTKKAAIVVYNNVAGDP